MALLLASCGEADEREAKYVQRGTTFFQSENYARARVEFRNALQINPQGIEAPFYLALMDEAEGKFAEAFGRYQGLVQKNPKHLMGLVKLGHFSLLSNDFAAAADYVAKAQKIDAQHAEVLTLQASVQFQSKSFDDALKTAFEAVSVHPNHAVASTIIAKVLHAQGNTIGAFEILQPSVRANPRNETLQALLIDFCEELDFPKTTEALHRSLIELVPTSLKYREEFAWFLIREGRNNEAGSILEESLVLLPRDDAAGTLYLNYLINRRDAETAIKITERLVEQQPDRFIFQIGLAFIYFRQNMHEEAEDLLSDVIRKDGLGLHSMQARILLAENLAKVGRVLEALSLLDLVLRTHDKHLGALALRAKLWLQSGNFNQAINDAALLVELAPRSKAALALLARANLGAGERAKAVDVIRGLYLLDPADTAIAVRLYALMAESGYLDLAVGTIKDYGEVTAENAAIFVAKTELLVARGEYSEALRVSRHLADFEPTSFLGQIYSGRLLEITGDLEEALVGFESAYALRPNSFEALNGIIRIRLSLGKFETAKAILKRGLSAKPNDENLHYLLGQTLVAMGADLDFIERSFRRAVALDLKWSEPFTHHGRALMERSENRRAIEVIKAGLTRAPDNSDLNHSLGIALLMAGEVNEAIVHFEQMVESGIGGTLAANNLAAIVADHRFDDISSLEQAYDMARDFESSVNPAYVDTLAWIYYRQGKYEEAERLMLKAIELGHTTPESLYHIGMVYLSRGKLDLARQALEHAVNGAPSFNGIERAREALAAL